jgi:hypothetical protein
MRAFLGEIAGGAFVVHDAEFLTGIRDPVQAEDLHGDGRRGFLEALALFVDERAGLAVILAADDDIAETQRAFAHEHGGHRTAGFDAGFDDIALGIAVGVRLQLQQVGLEQNHFEQLVHALLGERGAVHERSFRRPNRRA